LVTSDFECRHIKLQISRFAPTTRNRDFPKFPPNSNDG